MTLVDANGRILGRWNVVDVLVGVLLLFLIPLLYGGYLLFRESTASLTAVEPQRITADEAVQVTIRGTGLRPYMRVSLNERQGQNFLFADVTKAAIDLPPLAAGVYDVILYDQARELARIPNGVEVVARPRPQTSLDVIGSFTAVPSDAAPKIQPDLSIQDVGHVVRVGTPEPSLTRTMVGLAELINVPSASALNIPAVIRANCTLMMRGGIATCVANQSSLMRDTVMTLTTPAGAFVFQVDQVRNTATPTPLELRVRFAGERAVIDMMTSGDIDMPRRNPFAGGATIARLGVVSRAAASVVVSTLVSPQLGEAPAVLAGDVAMVDAVLRATGERSPDGWSYSGQVLKAGRPLMFHGEGYEVSGTILAFTVGKQ
jgi:hypothetical protein